MIRDFSEIDDVEITICADLSEERLVPIRKRLPGIVTTKDYNDVINNKPVDAVVIATPANTHYRIAKESLLAGKHTFVEKPLTFSPGEAEELVGLSKKVNRTLMVGHTFEFNPAVEWMKGYIRKKELGDVYYITSRRLNLGKIREDINAMWNLAPHDVSILIFLLENMPVEVRAFGASFVR
ncbi:MAG: Gfo/Idh/MocA family oxidoreductase, partial [Candidatus Omnitrophota bacterium]|nr:Gfo/Idh/MocA family oxidoreductase [Candidatus Omnitrophota bacterium]